MIKPLQLILAPGTTWKAIAESERGMASIFFLFWFPLMAFSSAAEGFALTRWGDLRGQFSHLVFVPASLAARYEAVQWMSGLIVLFGGAIMIKMLSHSYQLRPTYRRCFTVVAYGMSPLFLGRFLDCVPAMNTWVCWALGACISVYVLYQGIGLVLQPDVTTGFGIFLLSGLVLVLLSGIGHLLAVASLRGTLTF